MESRFKEEVLVFCVIMIIGCMFVFSVAILNNQKQMINKYDSILDQEADKKKGEYLEKLGL